MQEAETTLAATGKRSLDQAAADTLRQAILTGAIAPGSRLTETRLAEQMTLSRGPIRAALHKLVTEGLVIQQPYVGWRVISLSVQDAWEISTLRANFEGLAARLAAERIDDHGRERLQGAYDRLVAAASQADHAALIDADLALHKLVVDLAGHSRLAQHYAPVTHQIRLYIAATTGMHHMAFDSVCEAHWNIVESILQGMATEAGALASAHCYNSGRKLRNLLERGE
ncbi:hypothetical protein CAL12_16585 [Bordetella genomosp. 8]|uniref:HTH gntR-type domain-containing protein n=1 Tax=Bordetella genomosp. 8 TaxID=1416806 RepID=A0A1W6YMQ6_9BORD|nr:GntR family transcriptional regulator [Bordetella genomosp. 8]ARP82274.1 hypothetical protein CAL12_16585 [Bordetella genomosp. 8]